MDRIKAERIYAAGMTVTCKAMAEAKGHIQTSGYSNLEGDSVETIIACRKLTVLAEIRETLRLFHQTPDAGLSGISPEAARAFIDLVTHEAYDVADHLRTDLLIADTDDSSRTEADFDVLSDLIALRREAVRVIKHAPTEEEKRTFAKKSLENS